MPSMPTMPIPTTIARAAKIAMVASLGAFGLLVAFNNLTDYGSNFAFVHHVLAMDTTFPGNHLRWRAVALPAIWHLAYGGIILAEGVTGALFVLAAFEMLRARRSDAGVFARAKRWVPAATGLGFLVWFGGFSVVGGEWFAMWQSPVWNGQQPAFRFYISMLVVCLYVQQAE